MSRHFSLDCQYWKERQVFRCSGPGETDGGRKSKAVEELTIEWNRKWNWFRKDSVAAVVVFVVVAAEFDDT
jgi:hypothetical protein